MTTTPPGDPDCDRCDGDGLDPDAYTPGHTPHGTRHQPEPCRDCHPDTAATSDADNGGGQ
jgi:hypothetical protein